MTNINLLPWRELKREQQKKIFMSFLFASLVFAVFISILMYMYSVHLVSAQAERNQRIKTEIVFFDGQLKSIKELKKLRSVLVARMMIVKDLQSTRPLTVHLFDELVKVMPPGVVVNKVDRKKDAVTVWGFATANSSISELMRKIERSQWIKSPELTEIKKADKSKEPKGSVESESMENEFKLSFVLKQDKVVEKKHELN
jgi:type IV pilus assembly protein PilN